MIYTINNDKIFITNGMTHRESTQYYFVEHLEGIELTRNEVNGILHIIPDMIKIKKMLKSPYQKASFCLDNFKPSIVGMTYDPYCEEITYREFTSLEINMIFDALPYITRWANGS